MRILLAAFAAALACTAAASAQTPVENHISIAPGEAVTVEIDAGGVVAVRSRGPAEPFDERELATQRDVEAGAFGPSSGSNYTFLTAKQAPELSGPVQPNVLRLRFVETPERHMVLALENGYPQGVRYHAVMRRGDTARPTDVCTLPPHFHSFERWSFPLNGLELSGLELFAWTDASDVTCQE